MKEQYGYVYGEGYQSDLCTDVDDTCDNSSTVRPERSNAQSFEPLPEGLYNNHLIQNFAQ